MKVTNIMNFVRTFEPRDAAVEAKLFDTARSQLRLINEMGLPATVLLEYDALCDERYVELFRSEAGENIELGFWYEVVEPLCTDIGIPYNSARGYKWDWGIDPGFAMSYDNATKERFIDRFMHKFFEVFGRYPRTVGSWVIDTYTMNYLYEHYELDAICICRDQVNTDAYTMVGGYFNGLYYPSKNNIFTPAASKETQLDLPIIRLLAPDPIHNYDGLKYCSEKNGSGVYTLEPACPAGRDPKTVDWFFRNYYDNEHLALAYTQIGQENSFASFDLVTPLRMQFEKLLEKGIKFEKMCDTGAAFKKKFASTPASAVCALDNWDTVDCQSVYYSSSSYVANVFRHEKCACIRCLYLFDDAIADTYLTEKCTTFDSIHENMPIIDTSYQKGTGDGGCGLILDTDASAFSVEKTANDTLTVRWGEGKSVILEKDSVTLINCRASFAPQMCNTKITRTENSLSYEYKGHSYSLLVKGGTLAERDGVFVIEGERVVLIPKKKAE